MQTAHHQLLIFATFSISEKSGEKSLLQRRAGAGIGIMICKSSGISSKFLPFAFLDDSDSMSRGGVSSKHLGGALANFGE